MAVSAYIITHNNGPLLAACLQSLRWVDELVVVDDGSTDETLEIARAHQAHIYTHPFENFSAQRNYALAQCTGEWVVAIDADERLTPELRDELQAAFAAPHETVAFRTPRKNYFMGQWVRGCGWYPDYGVRIFRREGAYYTGDVHEALHIDGPVATLQAPVEHQTITNLEQYVAKTNRYTTLAAEGMARAGKHARASHLLLNPLVTFAKCYLLRGGWRDGWTGLAISALSAYYNFLKYLKLHYLGRGH